VYNVIKKNNQFAKVCISIHSVINNLDVNSLRLLIREISLKVKTCLISLLRIICYTMLFVYNFKVLHVVCTMRETHCVKLHVNINDMYTNINEKCVGSSCSDEFISDSISDVSEIACSNDQAF
jgi:hypothetical protein